MRLVQQLVALTAVQLDETTADKTAVSMVVSMDRRLAAMLDVSLVAPMARLTAELLALQTAQQSADAKVVSWVDQMAAPTVEVSAKLKVEWKEFLSAALTGDQMAATSA